MTSRVVGVVGLVSVLGIGAQAMAQDSTVVQRFSTGEPSASATASVGGPFAASFPAQRTATAFAAPSFPAGGAPVVPDIGALQQSYYGAPGYGVPGYGGGYGAPGYGGYGGGYGAPGYGGGYGAPGYGSPYGMPAPPQAYGFGAPSPQVSAATPPAAFGLPQAGQRSGRTTFGPPQANLIDMSPSTAPGPSAGLPAAAVSLRGRPLSLDEVADPSSEFYRGTGLEGLDARQSELADVAQAVGLKAGHAAEAQALMRALQPYEAALDQRFGSAGAVGRAVRWRDYLTIPAPSVVPPSGLTAKSRSDRTVWRRGVEIGWARGRGEARRLLAERLDALVRDQAAPGRADAAPRPVRVAGGLRQGTVPVAAP